MSNPFSYYNEETGEYIETTFKHLRLPDNLEAPVIDGVQRTMNLGITRASGWHYADNAMLFIPDYKAVVGQSLGFTISLRNKKGELNRDGLIFTFKNSGSFSNKILISDVFSVVFGVSDADYIRSLVGINTEYLTTEYIKPKYGADLLRSIKNKKLHNSVDVSNKLRTIMTTQTKLTSPQRLYDLLGLHHFIGCSLAQDTQVGNVFYSKFAVIDRELVFELEHSGLDSITILTPEQKQITLTILNSLYAVVNSSDFDYHEQEAFKALEVSENVFDFKGKTYVKEGAPQHNTLEIYTAIINRLFAFEIANINFSMQDYKNQNIVTFEEKVREFEREDIEQVMNRIHNTDNLLEGVSHHRFELDRVEKVIKEDDSALVVITKNENPLALTSQGKVLVRNVEYLAKEAVQVMSQDLGVIDPVDTPESKNIGKSTALTVTTKLGEDGSLYTPLYKVVDGVVTKEIEEVHVSRLPYLYIAEEGAELKGNLLAKHQGVVKLFPSHVITHVRVSPFSTTSVCRASSVFMENTDQKRTQMTANAQRQARSILRPKRALIETGIESIVANGQTGFKHIFTARDILLEDDYSEAEIENHVFSIKQISTTGMAKEFRLQSVSDPSVFSVFFINTEKSSYNSSYFYELVSPPDLSENYHIDDIVYKQHNIILSGKVEGTDRLAYHTNNQEDFFVNTVANGQDIFVMFGFSESFTVDDASIMSDEFIRDMSFATPVVITKKFLKGKIFNHKIEEKFGKSNGSVEPGYSADGLPLIGTYLNPGSTWLYRYEYDTEENKSIPKPMRLTNFEHGEVIDIRSDNEEIRVTLSKWVHVEVGDKFGGRHGNKTIIAKILPKELMPFDPITGRHVGMIINPLAMPSRDNISQIAEVQAAAEVKAQGLDSKVIPPFSHQLPEMIKNYENTKDITEVQFINPQTGLYYPKKHFCGYMHYLRNAKIAEAQLHAIGDSSEVDVAFLQPVGSSQMHEKGQSISSMEKEILISYGADGILDEIHSVLSADRVGFKRARAEFENTDDYESIDIKGYNNHAEHIQHAAIAFHSALEQDGENVLIKYMDDKVMEDYPEIDFRQLEYSLTDESFLNTIMKINFPCGFITPIAVKKFKFSNIIPIQTYNFEGKKTRGYLGKDAIESIISGSHYFVVLETSGGGAPTVVLFPEGIEEEHLESINMEMLTPQTGMESLIKLLEDFPIEVWIEHLESKYPTLTTESGAFMSDMAERINNAKALKDKGGFNTFITHSFPVLPNKYRQAKNELNSKDSISTGYKDIIYLAQRLKGDDKTAERLYKRINELDTKLYEFMAKKATGGRIRARILKTRVKDSLRSTIVPMFSGDPAKYGYPEFAGHPDSIGLPLSGALRIAEPRLLAYMKKNHPDIIKDARTPIDKTSLVIDILTLPYDSVQKITGWESSTVIDRVASLKKELIDFINGSYVFYGRAPSLHETSLRGGMVYVHEEKVIHLNSLLTTDLNADHDGDQIYVVMPVSASAVEDIKTKLLPSINPLRYNDGVPSLLITQDALLGLYFATCPPNDIPYRAMSSIEEIRYYLDLGLVNLNDPINFTLSSGKQIKSTAGRLVVNDAIFNIENTHQTDHLFEQEDGFFKLKYEMVISGGGNGGISVSALQKEIAVAYRNPKVITEIYHRLQEFGYRAVELKNLTIGLKDLTPVLLVDSVNKEIKKHVEVCNNLQAMGLLPEDYILDLSRKLETLVKELDIMSKVPDDNAFKILAVSGAKGKAAAIEKRFSVIGFVDSNNGVKLPTPILSNIVNGLSQYQVEDLSYTQRDNALSTVFETSKPGETLRSGAFTLSGLIVQEDSQENLTKQLVFYEKVYSRRVLVGNEIETAEPISDFGKYTYKGVTVTQDWLNKLGENAINKLELDQEGLFLFFDTENYRNVTHGTTRSRAKMFDVNSGVTFKGLEVDEDLLRQVGESGKPEIQLDDGTFLYFEVKLHEFASDYFKSKMDLKGNRVSDVKLASMLKDFPTHIDIATHINEFGLPYGISQSHAGFRSGTIRKYTIGENVGIKASTATSQPANQLVISKRNMDREGGLDNGIDLFKAAIQNGNFFKNDRGAFELLCPEDGVIRIEQNPAGTSYILEAESGLEYRHFIDAVDEPLFNICVCHGDLVFMGQTVLRPVRATQNERPVSPILSFVWTETTGLDGVVYEEMLINPSKDLIQVMRFYFMVYLEAIYKVNKIELDPNHYGGFALQATRFCTLIKNDPDKPNLFKSGYINLFEYFKSKDTEPNNAIVKMELTKGTETIMLTAGPVAALCYRDSTTAAAKAYVQGFLPENGSLGKVALGVNIKSSLAEEEVIRSQSTFGKVVKLNLVEEGETHDYGLTKEEEELMGGIDWDNLGGEVDSGSTGIFETAQETTTDKTEESNKESVEVEIGEIEVDTSSIFGGGS